MEKLESGSTSLDEAIDLFQKGRQLTKACEERLKEVEMKVQELVENADGETETRAFGAEDLLEESENDGEDE